jgi:hypothetical protein
MWGTPPELGECPILPRETSQNGRFTAFPLMGGDLAYYEEDCHHPGFFYLLTEPAQLVCWQCQEVLTVDV